MTMSAIARELGLSISRVSRLIARAEEVKARADPDQLRSLRKVHLSGRFGLSFFLARLWRINALPVPLFFYTA